MSLNNVLARTDGALFSGPTFNNTIWTDLTATRDAGSPEWLPIYDDGNNVRFVARASDLGRPNPTWGHPRVVYLQHASDPIAWWTPDLLFSEPDWLREQRGYDVLHQTRWIPGGDVPASLGRHGGRGGRAGRAWPPLRRRRRRRLGRGAVTARLDAGEDRASSGRCCTANG